MNILIIGGTRFLGAAVARELLRAGHTVTVFHRGSTQADLPDDVRHILGDARDRSQVTPYIEEGGFDAVVDTILRAGDLEWYLPLLKRHAGQLVHCGSTGVYAPASRVPFREDDPTPCPPEFGGFSAKLEQDRAIQRFYQREGFRACSLRISNVFGAGDVPLDVWGGRSPAYFQRVAHGEPIWAPNDGRALLQPVHVDDLAKGFRAAIEADDRVAGEVYNLSSDQAVTLGEYVRLTKELLGSGSEVRNVSVEEILSAGKANEKGLRFVCEHMCVDSAKARAALGYAPSYDVRAGLRDSLDWMVRKGLLKASLRP